MVEWISSGIRGSPRIWKREGKKIVCHYMGSDLRLRGVVPEIRTAMADLNLTNESDHLLLHQDIHYLFIPFDASPFTPRKAENKRLRIVHSPTNRAMKGTALILSVIESLNKQREIEFVLLEISPTKKRSSGSRAPATSPSNRLATSEDGIRPEFARDSRSRNADSNRNDG